MEVFTPEKLTIAKSGHVNSRVGEAAASAHVAVDNAAGAVGSAVQADSIAIDHAAAFGHQAISRAEDTVQLAERWMSEKTSALMTPPQNAVADAHQYISTHPWQSVGVALITGILLGRRTW